MDTYPALIGTLPVKPYDPAGFVGHVQADGQRPHVAACVVEPHGAVVCLSLVGAATSVSAALARLLDPRGKLFFEPAAPQTWDEPRVWVRDNATRYWQIDVRLTGTLAVQVIALPRSADLGDGLRRPPVIPAAATQQSTADAPAPDDAPSAAEAPPTDIPPAAQEHLHQSLAQASPRYLLGNAHESTPHWRSFLGVLRGLRAVVLNAPPDADESLKRAMRGWADALWTEGLRHALIVPLPALGMRGWRISGNLLDWSNLISYGVRTGWLPSVTLTP